MRVSLLLRRPLFVMAFVFSLFSFLAGQTENNSTYSRQTIRSPNRVLVKKTGQSQALSEPWVNLPSAPLVIKEYDRVMRLTNVSENTAVQYQLGCVTDGQYDLKIFSQNKPVKTLLPAYGHRNEVRESNIFILPKNLLNTCKKAKAKITVTGVTFENGRLWDGAESLRSKMPSPPVPARQDR